MPCKTDRTTLWTVLAATAVLLFGALGAAAGDEKPQDKPGASERTYNVRGATITWTDASQVSDATRERVARRARQFNDLLAGRIEAKDLAAEDAEAKVLADGTVQARVPVYLTNTWVWRPEAAAVCAQGAVEAAEVLTAPAPSSQPEVK